MVKVPADNDQPRGEPLLRVVRGDASPQEIAALVAVLASRPAVDDVAAKIRDGKVAAAGVLVGAVMKATRGQADATRVRELILDRLS